MLLVLAALVAVVVAVLVLGGGAALGMGDGRRPGLASTLPGLGLLGVFVVVALTVVAAVALFGVRGGGHEPGSSSREPRGETPTSPSTTAARPSPAGASSMAPGRRGGEPTHGPEVRVAAWGETEFADPARVADALADATVLRVTASGFVAETTGEAAQCTVARGGDEACHDRFPVRFDGAGTARFQYLVSADRCDRGGQCLLWVRGEDGRRVAVPLVFGDRAPEAATLTVVPHDGLEEGQTVHVSVAGLSPRSRLEVVQCAPPGLPVAERCVASRPAAPFVVGADGRGSTSFAVTTEDVGTGRHPCRRGSRCGIGLVSDGALVRADFVPVGFSAGPSASYDAGRMALGFAAAAAFVALAVWLIRTTDWREPTEAATPLMDAATLGEL